MSEWILAALDVLLIALVASGLVQATRLIRHLRDLRQGRLEMERFVYEFNATVLRAEAGIKGLRHAARESGDDLEKLVEKALLLRDELQFIVESADKLADRLSTAATQIVHTDAKMPEAKMAAPQTSTKQAPQPQASTGTAKTPEKPASRDDVRGPADAAKPAPSSRAEKELLQALQKLS